MPEKSRTLLVLPRLSVQNANAISSPMTWGFPSITAFIGFMHALERRVRSNDKDLEFTGVGVVCHKLLPQVTSSGYVRAFHLTRNPVDKTGKTAAIVEEGRVHLDLSLVFEVGGDSLFDPDQDLQALAGEVLETAMSLRLAGGSIRPAVDSTRRRRPTPGFVHLSDEDQAYEKDFRRVAMSLLPGFALVSRDELLRRHHEKLHRDDSSTSLIDAWLDISRINMECMPVKPDETDGESGLDFSWKARRAEQGSWLVPIPVGFGAISPVFEPGTVAGARDSETAFRFVESLYSIGQWISPHRLEDPAQLLWFVENDPDQGLYRASNEFEKHHIIYD